jgi:hypothetical protein
VTKEELAEIRENAQELQDRYLSPIAVNGLCTDIFKLLTEVTELKYALRRVYGCATEAMGMMGMLKSLTIPGDLISLKAMRG